MFLQGIIYTGGMCFFLTQEDRVNFAVERELDSAYFTMKDRGGANTEDLLEIGVCINNGTHLIEHRRWGPSRVNIADNQLENLTSANTIFGPWWFHYVSQRQILVLDLGWGGRDSDFL